MEGVPKNITPRTVMEVFIDFKGRRAALIKALTTDVDEFYQQCDPERENLCLYGLPNGTWEVALPEEEIPTDLPEPPLGINFARDGVEKKDWLSLVAAHSDSWLLSVAFYFGARFGFTKKERKKLFEMINDLPTLLEVVSDNVKTPNDHPRTHNSKSSGKPKIRKKTVKMDIPPKEEKSGEYEDEGDDEQGRIFCGINIWFCVLKCIWIR